MTRDELFKLHASLCAKGLEIMKAKNQDYAGKDGLSPFANFERSEVLGIPRELGLMLRVMDKFCRIKSFIESGTLAVKGEPVDDAVMDIINYMVLLQGMIEEKREPEKRAEVHKKAVLDDALGWPRATDKDYIEAARMLNGECPSCGGFFGASVHYCTGPKLSEGHA